MSQRETELINLITIFFAKIGTKNTDNTLCFQKTLYICCVKQLLYIFGLLFALFLFPPEKALQNKEDVFLCNTETITKEDSSSDMQHQISILSNDLKSNNLLTPRRAFQISSNATSLRVLDTSTYRLIQYLRVKNLTNLSKTQEQSAFVRSVTCSSLFCSMAHHVFAMRKLII